ncbi:MAG: phosphatidylserine decarboxylase family protein [Deltaproteobacteria bacterium]|nr:phosphatidylserine decarboxylase family protein [Deltaproteobacteria bacterium]
MRIPLAKEGYPFILISAAVTAVSCFWGGWLPLIILGPLTFFVVYFFRDPERIIPEGDDLIVSPADGRIIKVETAREEQFLKDETLKISIFMNVFNVHVNRAPAKAKVIDTFYNPGKFFNASFDKASLLNERNLLLMENEKGKKFVVVQIAGLIARRIVSYAKPGSNYGKGERFGIIRFGSRLDVYLPTECKAEVSIGQKVSAGSTILAKWR